MARGPLPPVGWRERKTKLPQRREIVPNLEGRFKGFMPHGCANLVEKREKGETMRFPIAGECFVVRATAHGHGGSQNQQLRSSVDAKMPRLPCLHHILSGK
jgi:hypothetical protein